MVAEEGWAFRQRLQHCVQRPEGRREHVLFVRHLGCARTKATVGEKECLSCGYRRDGSGDVS